MPRYKLLQGRHVEEVHDASRGPSGVPALRVYQQGDVFDSPYNLEVRFHPAGAPGMDKKFERVSDSTPLTNPPPPPAQPGGPPSQPSQPAQPPRSPQTSPTLTHEPLEALSVKELQQLAADEEIDTKGTTKKEDLVRLIRQARS